MDILEKVRQWLPTFPQWETGRLLYVDFTDGVPGNLGLYPAGLEEISRTQDVLGNITARYRYSFALYRVGAADEEVGDAAWLLAFQDWVLTQSEGGLAPQVGEDTRWRAEKGKLTEHAQPGSGVYVVQLTAEFGRTYKSAL